MERYTDKSGLFEDFNFKLVVIDALLESNKPPAFKKELKGLIEKYVDSFKWYVGLDPIPEMIEYFSQLKLEQADLDNIRELAFDGANQIYGLILPDWDGEDELFDVHSIKGFEQLKNLESVCHVNMCHESLLEPIKEMGIIIE